MAIVTGDVAIDFSGLSDQSPWVDADYEVISSNGSGTFQISSGVAINGAYAPYTAFRYIAAAVSSDVIIAKAQLIRSSTSANDHDGPSIVDSAGNGYVVTVFGGSVHVKRMDAWTLVTGTVCSANSQTFASGSDFALSLNTATGAVELFMNGVSLATGNDTTHSTGLAPGALKARDNINAFGIMSFAADGYSVALPTFRKSGTFTVETTLSGTVTSATLNGQAITVDSHVGTTVTLTDSDGSITTSGEYDLVLTDDSADPDETITVQVNVYGVTPSDNPVQKDGAALASLTGVEIRISAGATLAGSQLFYTATATTDASGNLGNIDLSATAAADTDPVLLSIRTAAGDSIIAAETVELI